MDREAKARVASAILQVPLLIRGAIGLVGDAQVVRDFMSPGTQENEILAAFLSAPWAIWVPFSLAGLGLFAWSLGWWPFRDATEKEASRESPVHPAISVTGDSNMVFDNHINYGPVTHNHGPQARAVPSSIASAFAGHGGRDVPVRVWLRSESIEARRLHDALIVALRQGGVDAASGGQIGSSPVEGVVVRPSRGPVARRVAAELVLQLRAVGMTVVEGSLGSNRPFLRIEIGENG